MHWIPNEPKLVRRDWPVTVLLLRPGALVNTSWTEVALNAGFDLVSVTIESSQAAF